MPSLKAIIETLSSPVGLIAVVFASGILLRVFRRRSRIQRLLVWGGAGLYLFLTCTPLAEVLYASLEAPYPPVLAPDPAIRKVVVLSQYGHEFDYLSITNKLGDGTVTRMTEGIRLYRELPDAVLIVSGGILSDQHRPIAELMAEFAGALGVPDDDIILERSSTTTYENLVEVNKIIGNEPFLLVTSSDHMRRAEAVALKLGMSPVPAPVGVWAVRYRLSELSWMQWGWRVLQGIGLPQSDRLAYLQRVHHEWLGYLWYRARGWI